MRADEQVAEQALMMMRSISHDAQPGAKCNLKLIELNYTWASIDRFENRGIPLTCYFDSPRWSEGVFAISAAPRTCESAYEPDLQKTSPYVRCSPRDFTIALKSAYPASDGNAILPAYRQRSDMSDGSLLSGKQHCRCSPGYKAEYRP
jgi:hypothetical protein